MVYMQTLHKLEALFLMVLKEHLYYNQIQDGCPNNDK